MVRNSASNLFGWSGVLGPLFAGLLGALSITAEVRYGTIRPTLRVNPLRRQVLAAKMWASMLIGCVFGPVAGLLVAGVGTAAMNSRDTAVQLSGGDYARIVLGSSVAAGLWGAVGVAVGAVIRSQVPALVGLVVWLLFIENLLVGDIARSGSDRTHPAGRSWQGDQRTNGHLVAVACCRSGRSQ